MAGWFGRTLRVCAIKPFLKGVLVPNDNDIINVLAAAAYRSRSRSA